MEAATGPNNAHRKRFNGELFAIDEYVKMAARERGATSESCTAVSLRGIPAMKTLSADTHPEVERIQIELLRQTPAWRKLELVGELNRAVQALVLSGLRSRYPQATPEELRRRLADLQLGPDLAAKVYGPLAPQATK